jgi:hypothetical protein
MRDRIAAVGGTLAIDSAPGRGTRVHGSVPDPGWSSRRSMRGPFGSSGTESCVPHDQRGQSRTASRQQTRQGNFEAHSVARHGCRYSTGLSHMSIATPMTKSATSTIAF